MKRTKTVIAMVMAVVLCLASVCPAMGAETAGEAGEAAAREEDTIRESDEAPEVAPIIEDTRSERNTEPRLASQGSVSGDSKVTWTKNTMPIIVYTSNGKIKKTYLTDDRDGYMRVAYDGESVIIEYFDEDYRMTKQGHLPMELGIWGGFYKGEDGYYIVEGQNNTDGVDGTEVVRIIKYDLNWKRVGAGSILAEEGWEYEIRYPFDYSCVGMSEVNGKLYVVTGREGYVDPMYGQGHQGMMLIRMDEKTFDTEIVYGDFWHSFFQYMDHSGTDLYICEQSEGSRCTVLSRFDSNRTGTDYFDAFSERFSVLDYGGSHTSAWSIPCYATVNDMAISSDNILCLGTSIDQSQYDSVSYDTSMNIYLTVTPKSALDSDHTAVKWLTDYSGDGKSFIGANITKINDDRFLVLWEEYQYQGPGKPASYNDPASARTLHYVFVDGAGKKIGKEFTAKAQMSDCKPILKGDRVVFNLSGSNCLYFYSIDAQSGEFDKKIIRVAGPNSSWYYNAGVLSISGKGTVSADLHQFEDRVTDIVVGENITAIADNTFAYNTNLKNVTLPDSVKSIGKDAFYYSSSDFTIHASCTSYAIRYAKSHNILYDVQHKWVSEVTKATPEKNGKIARTCSLCGETDAEKILYAPKTVTLLNSPMTYNGKIQRPEVVVKGSDGNAIAPDNYTLTYSGECKEIGSYSVRVDFKGNYSGTLTKNFRIVLGKTGRGDMFNLANNVKVTWKAVPGAKYYKVYREGVTDPGESRDEPVIVTTGLIGWDKQPGLTNGHAYRYRIVASTTGAGDSSGDSPLSYSKLMYRLKTVVLRSVKNTAPGKVTVKYDKTTSGDSYVLQYSENEDMTDAKTKVVLGAENTSYVIGGLKKGKTYYISIRVRKKVDGIDYYTTFGVAKKVTIVK